MQSSRVLWPVGGNLLQSWVNLTLVCNPNLSVMESKMNSLGQETPAVNVSMAKIWIRPKEIEKVCGRYTGFKILVTKHEKIFSWFESSFLLALFIVFFKIFIDLFILPPCLTHSKLNMVHYDRKIPYLWKESFDWVIKASEKTDSPEFAYHS